MANSLAQLEASTRNKLEALLMDFDESWTGNSFGDYSERLASYPSDQFYQIALRELVKIDLHRQWAAGNSILLEEYLDTQPALGTRATVAADLILAEYVAQRSQGKKLDAESYRARFPQRFDEFVSLLDSAEDSLLPAANDTSAIPHASVDTGQLKTGAHAKGDQNRSTDELPVEFGRYRILRKLGAGAMGDVYLAHDSQLDRQVAIKTPNFDCNKQEELVARFYREARSAAKLQHRNICPIFDVGELDGRHFISMAYIKGRCMSDYIKSKQLPPVRTSVILIHRLAIALEEAHRQGIIHRDLKPANIMIDTNREPVVMDFGLARQTEAESRMTQSGMAVGTPAYMSPEQIRGQQDEIGPAADVYALGVILYELLTGKIPFQGSIANVVHAIINEQPAPPSSTRSEVDQDLEAICCKMMAKDRSDRFASMEEVAQALKAYLQTRGQAKRKPGTAGTPSVKSPETTSAAKQTTDSGALSAFFAAQDQAAPQNTVVEEELAEAKDSPSIASSKIETKRTYDPRVLIAAGVVALVALAGIIIYFPDGTKVEVKDGSAKFEFDDKGNPKSLELKTNENDSNSQTQHSQTSLPSQDGPSITIVRPMQHLTKATATLERTIQGTEGALTLAVSQDGRQFAISNEGKITLWDKAGKRRVLRETSKGADGSPESLAFAPDGKHLLYTLANEFIVIDVASGKETSTKFPSSPRVVVFPKRQIAVAVFFVRPTGRKAARETPQRFRFWNWSTGAILLEEEVKIGGSMLHPAVSPDEKWFAYASGHHYHHRLPMTFIDGAKPAIALGARVDSQNTSRIRGSLQFSPDGQYAVGPLKNRYNMAYVLDLTSSRTVFGVDPHTAKKDSGYGIRLGFTPAGSGIASVDYLGRAALWSFRPRFRNAGEVVQVPSLTKMTTQHEDVPSCDLICELGSWSNANKSPLLAVTSDWRVIIAGGPADPRITIHKIDPTLVTPEKAPDLDDRAVAEQILEWNVTLISDGRKIRSKEQMPSSPFTIESIIFGRCQIGEELGKLRQLSRLRSLSFYGTEISDAGFAELGKLSRLTYLLLNRSPINDGHVDQITQLTQLRRLDLRKTAITDAGIAKLVKMTELGQVFLPEGVTKEAVQTLRGKMPGVQFLLEEKATEATSSTSGQ